MEKIKSFTDLIAWQKGHQLVISVYKITNNFPQKEIFALTNQMCRCAISITSNIAEGFSRKGTKEKIQFYHMSLGSLTELQNQLLIARDIDYLSNEEFTKLADQTVEVSKLINGLIRSLKKSKN
ncbi:MAG: four helix bundle protein [Candidatus Andersenbacteria bacterium]|nr:four helix bundle protein [Candidatus Andersenbacteria bacterium]